MLDEITYPRWLEIIQEQAPPVPEPAIRRAQARRPASGRAVLRYAVDDPPRTVCLYAELLQVSPDGITVRTTRELAARTPVEIELHIGKRAGLMRGLIVHSTSTVGAFKTGIELRFAGTAQPVCAESLAEA